jgi:hypothetical protein
MEISLSLVAMLATALAASFVRETPTCTVGHAVAQTLLNILLTNQ